MLIEKFDNELLRLKIKTVRKENDISQKLLSEMTHISQGTLSKYESGLIEIPNENVQIIFKALKIDELVNKPSELLQLLLDFQKAAGLSQKELAEKIGVSDVTLSYVLSKKRKPNNSVIKKIENLLQNSQELTSSTIVKEDNLYEFPKVDKIEVGKRIFSIRSHRNESLATFGKQFSIPVGKNVASRWEKGVNIPDIHSLMNVAILGDTTVPNILYGELYTSMLKESKACKFFHKVEPVKLGRRLRKIRKDKRVEREEFGQYLNPPSTKWSLDKYENGKDVPNTERFVQYAFIGNVSLSFLMYGE